MTSSETTASSCHARTPGCRQAGSAPAGALGLLALSALLLGSALRLLFGTAAFFGLALGLCGCLGLLALSRLLLGSALRFLLGPAALLFALPLLGEAALLGCGGFAS